MSNGNRQCMICRQNATFVQEHNRWFCDNCRKYLPREAPPPAYPNPEPVTTAHQPPHPTSEDELLIKTEVDKIFRKIGISGQIAALVMIIFGIVVILFPSLISWLIGLFLIIMGIITLIGTFQKGPSSPQYQLAPQEYRQYPPPSD